MKHILKIITLFTVTLGVFFSGFIMIAPAHADIIIGEGSTNNLNIGNYSSEGDQLDANKKLESIGQNSEFIDTVGGGEKALYNTLIRFARDLKNLFFAMATIFFLVIVIRLILSSNTDEELNNFKKGIIWITIGIIVMQLAYSLALTLFDKNIGEQLAFNLVENIVFPLLQLIQTLASIFFLAMAIYTFYRLVTANGAEDKIKSAKMTILYSIVGFMVIRFSQAIVEAAYGRLNCESTIGGIITVGTGRCLTEADLNGGIGIIVNILNWLNSFVGIVVVIMIMYAGFQVLISGGDEERLKKGKQTMIYIAIGLVLLVMNYLILTFFLVPESVI